MEIFRHSQRWKEQWTPISHHKDSTVIKILSHLLYVPHSVFPCFSILDQTADLTSFHLHTSMSQHTALKKLDISYITAVPFWYPIKKINCSCYYLTPSPNLSNIHQNTYKSECLQNLHVKFACMTFKSLMLEQSPCPFQFSVIAY